MSDTVDAKKAVKPLDEVLLAMDVVDTLRHRAQLVDHEINAEARRVDLLGRLRDIYKAQGIEVPDHILEDGVKALEERRFSYTPPKDSFSVKLAKLYVSRKTWGRPLAYGAAGIAALGIGYQAFVAGPAQARAAEIENQLNSVLPGELQALYSAVSDLAIEDQAKSLADLHLANGRAAIAADNVGEAEVAISQLRLLETDLSAVYDVRIRYRGGAQSGFFRGRRDQPNLQNYYVIVEAVDAAGNVLNVPITSEEADEQGRVDKWAQRVSRAVFERVASDKSDDQIIQNDTIGRKVQGYLSPEYTVDTPGGAILTW